ncbi:MAG: outer membrane lipoprotein-sorting protein [Bacteroidales bacterium]|nr:outer membrane lipoprotein-sorting protein [Bacteroidales bacterium]
MKTTTIFLLISTLVAGISRAQKPDAREILNRIDKNMASENRVFTSRMIIYGARNSRTLELKTWTSGESKSFSEYLSPPREKGTKMLKLDKQLWIYSPATDRIIQISGHMLRQSVMGSDLSYEDLMEDARLSEKYEATILGEETLNDRPCWVLELNALSPDMSYQIRKLWVDKVRFIPLKEELYAKSGKLLKRTTLSQVENIGGRWFPRKIEFRDMLKEGKGTEFIIDDIRFDVQIPDYIFSKANLKK